MMGTMPPENAAEQVTRMVTVVDTTKPDDHFERRRQRHARGGHGLLWTAGATWTDTLDGNGALVAAGTVDVNMPGVYVLDL